MGGSTKEQLELLEQKIRFALRPLINTINTSGMTRERRIELDALLLEISTLQQNVEEHIEREGSTESRTRLAVLVDHLYSLIKGMDIAINLPERREYARRDLTKADEPPERPERPKDASIVNLSVGGMRLRSATPMKIGSVVRTQLESARYGQIVLRGEVIWVQEETGESYIIGIHFLPMDEDELRALKDYIGEPDG
ncbi:MAG: PilZ domain-containing protein [Syntrophobacteria bacterium]